MRDGYYFSGRSGTWCREPREPREFSHHAVLRGADPRLFEALCRDLALRLYEGRAETRGGARSLCVRQGPHPRLGAYCLGLGAVGLLGCLLVGNGLGHGFHQGTWDGGVAHAAVPTSSLLPADASRSALVAACLGLIGGGTWLTSLRRRHFWIVAQAAADARTDVWIAGTSWRHESAFEAEFAELLERARQKQQELETPGSGAAEQP